MTFSELEEARKEYRKKKIICSLIITIIIVVSVWVIISLSKYWGIFLSVFFIGSFCLIVSLLINILYGTKERQVYRRAYKEFFVVKSLEKHFSGFYLTCHG